MEWPVTMQSTATDPTPGGRPHSTSRGWVSWLALLLAAVAGILGAVALLRAPSPVSQAPTAAPVTLSPPPSPRLPGAAGDDTCSVAVGAAEAIARDRRPFLDTPSQWDDPITVAALTRAQASALVELEAMRSAVGPSTPAQLAEAITAYRSGILDTLDADIRRLPAAISNAASDRAAAAARKITTFCKGE